MKTFIIFISVLSAAIAHGQRTITPSDSCIVSGKIKQNKIITVSELEKYIPVAIKEQIIYNHKGEIKDTISGLKGVLLKTVLNDVVFIYDKPKQLNEFYFVFIATDGYKVVCSWNELYNSEIGNNCYFITEMNGKKLHDISERIVFLSTADLMSGRRYIKGLERIEVRQVD